MMTLHYYFDEHIEDGLYGARALEIMKKIIEDTAFATNEE
jgi:pyruvate/2-oxoglutarate dehydrogenase complex dihydrolipoamide acyltransferase (E2) component